MTLGQRIQELRKQSNLSQEALGEKMGVSRQAISKWESDLTIPELDKLIAMSKLFDIPMGQLLGMEEENEGASDFSELTEKQLAAVENVAASYLEAASAQTKRYKNWILLGAAVELFVVLAFVVCLAQAFRELDRLSGYISSVDSEVNSLRSSLSYQDSYFTQRLEELLAEQNSLVEEWDYELDQVKTGGRCALTVRAVPRSYTAGMTALLTFQSEGSDSIPVQGVWDGQSFRFPAELKTTQAVDLTLSLIEADGSQQTQNLGIIEDLASRTRLAVKMDTVTCERTWTRSGSMELNYVLDFQVMRRNVDDELGIKPVSLALELEKNGAVVEQREVILKSHLNDYDRYLGTGTWKQNYKMVEGDSYWLRYRMEDNLGQIYEGDILRVVVEDRKGLVPVEQPIEAPAVD